MAAKKNIERNAVRIDEKSENMYGIATTAYRMFHVVQ